MVALTEELLDPLLATDRADAAVGLAHPLPMQVIAERVIGFRDPDLDQIRRWVFDGSRLVGGLLTLDQMASFSDVVSGMAPWTTAQLDAAIAARGGGRGAGRCRGRRRQRAASREKKPLSRS